MEGRYGVRIMTCTGLRAAQRSIGQLSIRGSFYFRVDECIAWRCVAAPRRRKRRLHEEEQAREAESTGDDGDDSRSDYLYI
jgi:hypothetical protein